MFGIGSTELIIIIIVALIVVGPSKLPQLMRSVGKGLAELRSVGADVKSTLEREVDRAERESERQKAKENLKREGARKPKPSEEENAEAVELAVSDPAGGGDTGELVETAEAPESTEASQNAAEDGETADQPKSPAP
jgi:sec-independent protein translocase protein TatB